MTGEEMSVGTLEELLIDELKDLYSAEKQDHSRPPQNHQSSL
jgi:ferritin-like metal-binding protein YciE